MKILNLFQHKDAKRQREQQVQVNPTSGLAPLRFILLVSGFGCLFFTASCSSVPMMKGQTYEQVFLGEHIKQLTEEVGKPYEIRELPSGLKEYIYIERTKLTGKRELFREYHILIGNDGRVLKKSYTEIVPPPFEIMLN